MKLKFDQSFLKSLEKLTDETLKKKISVIILNTEKADSILNINQIKKLKGYKSYYRIKSGDYRLGIELIDNNTLVFITIMHRKDIYKKFP